jgi:hypothetical protein
MAKHLAFLHLGPRVIGVDAPHEALLLSETVARTGLAVPRVSSKRMSYADLEIRRRHTEAGLTRKAVEGAWADVCRKLYKAKTDVVVSQPDFLLAPRSQAALALDGLFGFQVHLVLTPDVAPEDLADLDVDELLGTWAGLVTKPERIHVLPMAGVTGDEAFTEAVVDLAERVRSEREIRRLFKRARKAEKKAAEKKAAKKHAKAA